MLLAQVFDFGTLEKEVLVMIMKEAPPWFQLLHILEVVGDLLLSIELESSEDTTDALAVLVLSLLFFGVIIDWR